MSQLVIFPWEVQTRIVGKLALIACILLTGTLLAIAALGLTVSRAASHLHDVGWHPQKVALANPTRPLVSVLATDTVDP
jgi:hypothetical protein